MTSFIQNLMLVPGLDKSSLFTTVFLVLNAPGQPMTIYDKNTFLNTKRMTDIYDRVMFKCLDSVEVDLDTLDLTFLSFGYGSLIATSLALNFGHENNPIKKFVSFNGIFKVDSRVKSAFRELREALTEAHPSMHQKLLDIANNCKKTFIKTGVIVKMSLPHRNS